MKQEKKNREFSSFFSHTHKSLKSHTHQRAQQQPPTNFNIFWLFFQGTTWKKHLWRVIYTDCRTKWTSAVIDIK
jgi:hypothetical protein